MRSSIITAAVLAAGLIHSASMPAVAQTLIVGNDEKNGVDQDFKPIIRAPGHDSLSVIDIADPGAPKITATIPLINSVVGPPVNLAIVPGGNIALVANSLKPVDPGLGPPAGTRRQGLRRRSESEPAQGHRHRCRRQAALRHCDRPQRRSGAGGEPGGRHDLGPVDPRQQCSGRRHGADRHRRRPGFGRRHHPRWQARAGDQARREQGRAADHRRRQGDLYQARPADRHLPLQRRGDPRRQAGADRRQWRRRLLGRQYRHGRGHRSGGQPTAGHQSRDGRRFARGAGGEPEGEPRRIDPGGRLQHARRRYFTTTPAARSRSWRSTAPR